MVRSLIWNTDLIFTRFEGEVIDRLDYVVARTLSKPNFYWGNFLLFPNAPILGDLEKWSLIFDQEFRGSEVKHKTFGWDVEQEGEVEQFQHAGYAVEKYVGLVATFDSLKSPTKYNLDIHIRPIASQADWDQVIEVQVASASDYLSKVQWRNFYSLQALGYQKLVARGLGNWHGAFIDEKLVGSLGLFFQGSIGRFQTVSTHPEYQRRAVCSTLVYEVAKKAFRENAAAELVMVAYDNNHAARIYESVGFLPKERVYGVCWRNESLKP